MMPTSTKVSSKSYFIALWLANKQAKPPAIIATDVKITTVFFCEKREPRIPEKSGCALLFSHDYIYKKSAPPATGRKSTFLCFYRGISNQESFLTASSTASKSG